MSLDEILRSFECVEGSLMNRLCMEFHFRSVEEEQDEKEEIFWKTYFSLSKKFNLNLKDNNYTHYLLMKDQLAFNIVFISGLIVFGYA